MTTLSQWDHRDYRKYAGWIAAVLVTLGATACGSAASPLPAATAAASTVKAAAAEPETEAGVRAVATQFYALYAAGQWPLAWAILAPSSQQAVPESLYVAVHQGCPSGSAGMARVIKSVVMAGSTAVVTETVAGALGSLATAADAWTYDGGRWGFVLSAADMSVYSHGSAAADVASAKAAGDCAGAQPLPTVAPATMQPPTFQTLAPLPTVAPATVQPPTFQTLAPLPTVPAPAAS